MAGPNVELFKFGLYLFFPLAIMIHVGDPEWYERHVRPIRDSFWPSPETLYVPPRDQPSIQAELARLRAERRAKAAQAIEEVKDSRAAARSSASSAAAAPAKASAASAGTAGAVGHGIAGRLGGLVRPSDLRYGLSVPQGVVRDQESEGQKSVRREYWRRVAEGRNV